MTEKKQRKISMIQAQKRIGRFNLYIDDQYAFPISEETFIKFRLSKGMEIDKEFEQKIKAAEAVSSAYSIALNYLTGQLRTEQEVRKKLHDKEIEDDVIDSIILRLEDQRLLDDLNYAESYVRTMVRTSDKGPRVIANNLKNKGVSQQNIQNSLEQFSIDKQIENTIKIGKKAVQHYKRLSSRQRLTKVKQLLMTKGFNSDVIQEAMLQINIELGEENEYDNLVSLGKKAWNKNRRFDFRTRKLKTKQALYQKGFALDLIDQFLNQIQEDCGE